MRLNLRFFYFYDCIYTMPYVRKKRMPRRRRFMRRRLSRSRYTRGAKISRKIAAKRRSNFYSYGRWEAMQTIQVNTQIYYGASSFRINDLLDISTYQTMWDQYKIKAIVIRFRLTTNPNSYLIPNSTTTNQNTLYPDIYCTVDHDDASTPTSINQIQEYNKCKQGVLYPNKWFSYKFYPRFANLIYQTGLTQAYDAATRQQWADMAYPDVPHYGFKFALDTRYGTAPNQNYTVQYQCFYHVLFKDSR